jgi:hypothetical protein
MRTPTVTLRRPSTGQQLKVDRWRYALNMAGYLAKGYRLVSEARGELSEAQLQHEMRQAEIEKTREQTREAPKNYEARKIKIERLREEPEAGWVGEVEEAHVTAGGDTVELTPAERNMPGLQGRDDIPKAAESAPPTASEPQADKPPAEARKPATRATRGRRKAS